MSQAPYLWTGEVMQPLHPTEAKQTFQPGQTYWLSDRSDATHKHHFAFINAVWKNLPHDIAENFPSAEHLRKWALIEAGWFKQTEFTFASRAEALRFCAFMTTKDDYCRTLSAGSSVMVREAKSQKLTKQDSKDFRVVKEAVREILSDLIKVAPEVIDSWKDTER